MSALGDLLVPPLRIRGDDSAREQAVSDHEATELGIPRGTVNSRLRRGLDKLSRQLDREQVR
jgi:hypothetical protein